MRSKHLGIYYSLLATLIAIPGDDAFAGIRISNKSRNQYVSEMTYQAQQAQQAQIASAEAARIVNMPTELPVHVEDQNVADKLMSGQTNTSVSMEQLDSCSMIFPNGEFLWARPTTGSKAGGPYPIHVKRRRVARGSKRLKPGARLEETCDSKKDGRAEPKAKERSEAELRNPRQRMEEGCGFLQPKRMHAKSQTLPDLPRRLGAPRQRALRRGSRIMPKKSSTAGNTTPAPIPAA